MLVSLVLSQAHSRSAQRAFFSFQIPQGAALPLPVPAQV